MTDPTLPYDPTDDPNAGIWDLSAWDNAWLWEDLFYPDPPDGNDYTDSRLEASVEIGAVLRLEQEIPWSVVPPSIMAMRMHRTVVGDYRVSQGVPKSPPPLDCSVPVRVGVDPMGVSVPSATRLAPGRVDTGAALRWIAEDTYVNLPDISLMQWWDSTGSVAWLSYDSYQPVLDDDYTYVIVKPNADEVIERPALVFDALLGSCMSLALSINPANNIPDVEFWLVCWTHTLGSGQQFASVLDNGDPVRGFHDMPYNPQDSLAGRRQALLRYPDKLTLNQSSSLIFDSTGVPDPLSTLLLTSAQVSSGRPVLYRVRFGVHPLIESWGPTNTHSTATGPVADLLPLASNYVLGRQFNSLSTVTNGGMHLFEINYFDHMLSDDEARACRDALSGAYAVTA